KYDKQFERALAAAILEAIAAASVVTDPGCRIMAIRTGETLEALTTVLCSFAAMSPFFDTPSHLREFAETLAKRVRRDVSRARAEGLYDNFVFGAQRRGGRA